MLNGKSILILEDEVFLRKTLGKFLEAKGADVLSATSIAEARNLLDAEAFDYALLDIHLPDGESLQLLREGVVPPSTGVVIMTAEGGVETAVEAMKLGAADYLRKPFEPDEIAIVLSRLGSNKRRDRIDEFKRDQAKSPSTALFFGDRMAAIQEQLEKIRKAEQRMHGRLPPMLIEGETGTGKSTLARWVHREGIRANKPLIEVNCSTLPETLAESELFGHEKGAFTDARNTRIGLFEAADGGTLFLDEIAHLSPQVQTKILTAIENGVIRRLGGTREIPVDVRIIAASIRPLEELMNEGGFREDLFHRLHLLALRIPPLREFPRDIPPLAEHLLNDLRNRHRIPRVRISTKGMERLQLHSWPGNVRELAHELERGLIFMGQDELDFETLGDTSTPGQKEDITDSTRLLNPAFRIPADFNFESSLDDLQQAVIAKALDETAGNVSAAARKLGVPRDFVRYRCKNDD